MVSYSGGGCGITCLVTLGRIQMFALLRRKPGEAWCCLVVLQASPSFSFTHWILLQWGERGTRGGWGNRVSALSFACCWMEHNKTANAADSPSSICCQRVREAGAPLWSSCLGSSFSQHSKEVGNKLQGTLASLPRATTPNYVGCWHAASPALEAWYLPGVPRYFSYTSKDVTSSRQRVALPSCKFGLPSENEIFGRQSHSETSWGWRKRGWGEGFADTREPLTPDVSL